MTELTHYSPTAPDELHLGKSPRHCYRCQMAERGRVIAGQYQRRADRRAELGVSRACLQSAAIAAILMVAFWVTIVWWLVSSWG